MHKNRLQELCHKQMWAFPAYNYSRDGPDHDPRFRASVVVNGHTFYAPNLSKSVKEAHNNAAEVALHHLSSIASASSTPAHLAGDTLPPATEIQTSYKTQLHHYVQKRNIGVLKYDFVRKGSAHALRFKASVTVDGQTFESSEYFSTLREAEHSAARVALMSLPLEENHQDDPIPYKNLLQQLVQKEGLSLPLYNTHFNGAAQMPIFTSTVVVEGESFVGDAGRTKRQAEMNAAKVAWYHVKERINVHSMKVTSGKVIDNLEQPKIHPAPPSFTRTDDKNQSTEEINGHSMKVTSGKVIDNLEHPKFHPARPSFIRTDVKNQSTEVINVHSMKKTSGKVIDSLEQPKIHAAGPSFIRTDDKNQSTEGKVEDNERVVNTTSELMNDIFSYDLLDLSNLSMDSCGSAVEDGSAIDQLNSLLKLDFDDLTNQEDIEDDGSSEDIDTDDDTIKDINIDDNKIVDSPLLCNRVRVYPQKSDMILPPGSSLLPFTDDVWVAVSLDF